MAPRRPTLTRRQVASRAVIFTARRLSSKHRAAATATQFNIPTQHGTTLAAINAGRLPNGRIFAIGIAVPSVLALRAMAAGFRGLVESSRKYDASDVWPIVTASMMSSVHSREDDKGEIRRPAARARAMASQVFPGEERVLAVRDTTFATLEKRGELALLQDACRMTGIGLLRVYPDGVCKWSVVPV